MFMDAVCAKQANSLSTLCRYGDTYKYTFKIVFFPLSSFQKKYKINSSESSVVATIKLAATRTFRTGFGETTRNIVWQIKARGPWVLNGYGKNAIGPDQSHLSEISRAGGREATKLCATGSAGTAGTAGTCSSMSSDTQVTSDRRRWARLPVSDPDYHVKQWSEDIRQETSLQLPNSGDLWSM